MDTFLKTTIEITIFHERDAELAGIDRFVGDGIQQDDGVLDAFYTQEQSPSQLDDVVLESDTIYERLSIRDESHVRESLSKHIGVEDIEGTESQLINLAIAEGLLNMLIDDNSIVLD